MKQLKCRALFTFCLLALIPADDLSARPVDRGFEDRVAPSALSPQVPALPAAPGDTAWFGGTMWAADSARWEAVPGGVWTFDTGTASHFNPVYGGGFLKDPGLHAQMEGWLGYLHHDGEVGDFFRRVGEADFGVSPPCVGDVGGLGGDYSLYAGVLPDEADSLGYVASGPGYGNNWDVSVRKEFAYPGAGQVALEFDYAVDTEPGYDFVYLSVDTSGTGDEVVVASYDGSTSGHEGIVLNPGVTLPTTAGTIALRFEFVSDGSYSDEDGAWPTGCGAFAVDNIELGGAIVAGPMTFEAGDEGWVPVPGSQLPKDWSDIVALSDLPAPMVGPCALQDSVLVFLNLDAAGPYENGQTSVAVSPWIDLARAGETARRGKVLQFDVYMEAQPPNVVVVAEVGAQWDPCIDPVMYTADVSPVSSVVFADTYTSTQCIRFRVEIGHGIPLEAEQIRVVLGVVVDCFGNACATARPTPWFDNVRLGVHGDAVMLPVAQETPPAESGSWSTLITGDASTRPAALCVGPLGRIYVTDIANDRVQKYDPDGMLLASWGQLGSGPGEFNFTECCEGGIAVSSDGFVYVADSQNNRVQKFTPDGTFLLAWGSPGAGDGQFFAPKGIAVDDSGHVYVAGGGRVQKFESDSTFIMSWPVNAVDDIDVSGGRVTAMGSQFGIPTFQIYTTDGVRTDSWGGTDHPTEGPAAYGCEGRFLDPKRLAVGSGGEVYVTHDFDQPGDDRIEKYTHDGAFLAGWHSSPGAVDPHDIWGIGLSPSGHRIYVSDAAEGVIKVFGTATTSVGGDRRVRPAISLAAYPNPFTAQSRLVLGLPAPEDGGRAQYRVKAQVFDIAGRRVSTLFEGSVEAGRRTFTWDGRREDGARAAAGIYFFRAQVDGREAGVRKVVRLP